MTVARRHNKIKKMLKKIKQHNAIPSPYQRILEERLVIAFTPNSNEPRSKGKPRSRAENRTRFKQRKAHEVYSDILIRSPHVFVPFLLVTSPRVCETFDSFEFFEDLEVTQEYKLTHSVEQFLKDVGRKNELTQDCNYVDFLEKVFPKAPTTEAESDETYQFLLASFSGISLWFGNFMTTKIESSLLRLQEITKSSMQTTECVRTMFPRRSFQDVVISINVGSADELARVLFPHTEDHANSISKGASVSAIQSIFPSQICDAIEKSELRIWERSHQRQESTDCVIMEGLCLVRLRVQYHAAVDMVTNIYP